MTDIADLTSNPTQFTCVSAEYDFDETAFTSGQLKVLAFSEKASVEWIQFVDDNRNRRRNTQPHGYDIVKGPIADDGVAIQLCRLRVHADSAQAIAANLQDKYLDQQIYFGTPESLEYLKKLTVCKVK